MKSVKLFVYMKGFRGIKTVVKFDVPCNPWMNWKALTAGTAPALGNAVLSLERHAGETAQPCLGYGCQEPSQACVCAKLAPHSLGQNQIGPPLQPALVLHWGKSRNTIKTREGVHSTGSLVRTVEGAGNVQNACCAAGTRQGGVRPVLSTLWMAGKGWHAAVSACPLGWLSALTQPQCSQQHHSLSPRVCMLCDSVSPALSCSTAIQYKQGNFSAEARVSTKLPERSQAKATQNNRREFRVHKTSLHC